MGDRIEHLELWVGCSPHEEIIDKINEIVDKVNDMNEYLARKYNEDYKQQEESENE